MKRQLLTLAGAAILAACVGLACAALPIGADTQPGDVAGQADPDPGAYFSPDTGAASPVIRAEGWADPVNVSASPGPSGAPVLGVDSSGTVHLAWYDNNPGNWEILYSTHPTGGPWSSPENVSANASYSLVPHLVIEPNDHVDLVWQDYGGPRIAWQGTLLFKTREPGEDFAPPQAISATAGFGGYPEVRDPYLAVDSLGTIHLMWAGNTASGYRIFYARRPLGGLWTFPTVINPGSGSSLRPRLVIDAADVLHVVWQEMPGASVQSDIYYSSLSAGVWSTPVNISANSGMSQEPWLIYAHGVLHVAWRDYTADAEQGEVLYAKRPVGGAWSLPENVSRTPGDSAGPALAEDDSYTLHLVWYDNSPGNWEILYATKQQDGIWTSGANISQTAGRSGQPYLVYDGRGKLHLSWADDTPGDFDVFYTSKVVPVFSTSVKRATATALAGENIGYVVVLRNPSPSAITLMMTDTLPGETTYVAGSAQASSGVVSASGNEVTWNGVVPALGTVEVRFVASVNIGVPVSTDIRNRATISDESGAAISVEASTRVVLTRLVAPLILQAH
jgi:uncharacterized repeat protein (TIGR01451 family)